MNRNFPNFELILTAITDGIVVVDTHGIVLYANRSAEQIFERGDLTGKDLAIPLYPSASGQAINLIRPGGIGWAELRSAPITWNEQPGYVIGVRDVTARKNDELKLH